MQQLRLLVLILVTFIFSCEGDKIETIVEEPVDLGFEIISIEIPKNFMREEDNLHAVIFDTNGDIIDTQSSLNSDETLTFYSKKPITDTTPFSLAFISDHNNTIFNVNIYYNLTKVSLEGKIVLSSRGYPKRNPSLIINAPNFNNNFVLNAQGHGYSLIKVNSGLLTGHYTDEYNENLGPNNVLIKYFNPSDVLNDNYKWAYINNISTLSTLEVSDLSSENVQVRQLSTNRPTELPLLDFLGFENEELFSKISGHQLYNSHIPAFGFGSNHYYSFPNIFHKTIYSISFSNYSLFNVGIPPDSIDAPNINIDSSYSNGKLTFSGAPNYEVGRIMLDNYAKRINVQLVFDGSSTEVIIPKLPSGIISDDITNSINNGQLRLVQTIAENYSSFLDYNDYISKVLRTTTPFYLSSPKRERIFKAQATSYILPTGEFPFYGRFR